MNQKIYYFAREMGSTAYYLSIASRDIPCSIELVSSEGNGISQVIWGAGTCFINYYSNGGSYSMLQLVEDANAGGSDNCSVTGYRLGWLGGNFDGNEVGESIPLTNYGDCTSSNSSCSRLYFQPGEILLNPMPQLSHVLGRVVDPRQYSRLRCQGGEPTDGYAGYRSNRTTTTITSRRPSEPPPM